MSHLTSIVFQILHNQSGRSRAMNNLAANGEHLVKSTLLMFCLLN